MQNDGDKRKAATAAAARILAARARRRKKITYQDLANQLSDAVGFRIFYGGAPLRRILDEISEATFRKHDFILRAIVVYTDSGKGGGTTEFSGKGFFALAKQLGRDFADTAEGKIALREKERARIFAHYANGQEGAG